MNNPSTQTLQIAKLTVPKATYAKLKKIKDATEQAMAAKYAIHVALEDKFHKLQKLVAPHKHHPDYYIIQNKLELVPSKIKHLEVEYRKDEFYKLQKLFQNIETEVHDVRLRKKEKRIGTRRPLA